MSFAVSRPSKNIPRNPASALTKPRSFNESDVRAGSPLVVPFNLAEVPIQPKLKVSRPGDEYEQEADRIADQIIGTSLANSGVSTMEEPAAAKEKIYRKCAACEETKKREGKDESGSISRKKSDTHDDLHTSDRLLVEETGIRPAGGSSLDSSTKEFMESRFGYNFSGVRIHTGPSAARSADSINALAYTLGNDVVFAEGHYEPSTLGGRRLLAHELVHVIQQQRSIQRKEGFRPSSGDGRQPRRHVSVRVNHRRPGNALLQRQPQHPATAPAIITPASEADVREFVRAAIDYLNSSAEHFELSRVDQAVLERVLRSWSQMATTYIDLIQTRLNGDAALLQSFKTAFNTALRMLFTRAAISIPNTSVMQLYLSNLHRLPEWARPDVASFNLTNEVQRRAFISSLTNAFNQSDLFQGYTSIDESTLQSLLRYTHQLISDSQDLVAANLGNDASLLGPLRSAYSAVVNQLLSRASTATGQSVQQLFMKYRYGAITLIHEWADQTISGITAAVPLGTSADPLSGNVDFSHNGFQVAIQPDGTQTGSGATTHFDLRFNTQIAHNWDGHNIITSFTPPITPIATIRTDYGPGSGPSSRSGYGRGTTAEDVRLGNTSLGHHERSHSRDYLRYISNHRAPVFTGAIGMTRSQFNTAVADYVQAMQSYNTAINRASELATDCVGSPNIVQYHTAAGTRTTVTCP